MSTLLSNVLRLSRTPGVWRAVLVVLTGVVCCLALTPPPADGAGLGWDKLNHALAFAALAVASCFGFRNSRPLRVGGLVGLLVFGGLIELIQHTVPGRQGDWLDWLADAVGIAAGTGLAWLALRWSRQHAAMPLAATTAPPLPRSTR